MRTVTWIQVREQRTRCCDEASATGAPLRVTRPGHRALVLPPADEVTSLLKTVHLLRSPANVRRRFEALDRAGAGPDACSAPAAVSMRPPSSDCRVWCAARRSPASDVAVWPVSEGDATLRRAPGLARLPSAAGAAHGADTEATHETNGTRSIHSRPPGE